jgi:hypothetical protein
MADNFYPIVLVDGLQYIRIRGGGAGKQSDFCVFCTIAQKSNGDLSLTNSIVATGIMDNIGATQIISCCAA